MSEEEGALRRRYWAAQKRLLDRYGELKGNGGWRAVAGEVGVNLRFVHDFAVNGSLPKDETIRQRLLRPRKDKPMNLAMQKLLNILKFHHVGKDHAIKRRDLLAYLYGPAAAQDESNNNRFDREMREMIEKLNQDHGALICPSVNGYFWGSSLDETLKAIEPIEKSARTQLIHVGHLKANAKRQFGGQLGLDM